MRDFFIEKLVTPLADAASIDGVFYDCFNYAYQLPSPWNRRATNVPNCTTSGGAGCEALLNGWSLPLLLSILASSPRSAFTW